MTWRNVTRVLLVINALIASVTAFNLIPYRDDLPVWLTAVILGGLVLFIAITLLYVYELGRVAGTPMPQSNGHTRVAWVLLVSSVVCTAALHKFWPLRPGIVEYWRRAAPILRYNFIWTAAACFWWSSSRCSTTGAGGGRRSWA